MLKAHLSHLAAIQSERGSSVPAGKVYLLHRIAVHAVGKEQYFKIGRLHIAVHACLLQGADC